MRGQSLGVISLATVILLIVSETGAIASAPEPAAPVGLGAFMEWIAIVFITAPPPPFGPACVWLKSAAPKDVTRQEGFAAPPPVIVLKIVGLARVMICPHIALRPSEALAQCQRRPHDRTRQR
jgi:hypothetical protein